MVVTVQAPTDTFPNEVRAVTAQAHSTRVVDLPPDEMRSHLSEALGVYVRAMGYPLGTDRHRAPMWVEHSLRPGWRGVAALTPENRLIAISYGYPGAPEQWWYRQVRDGMRRAGIPAERVENTLRNYFELTELHVEPHEQGSGIGRALLLRLLEGVEQDRVLLSTPEVPDEANRAWRLYRSLGFQDAVRNFTFSGDRRPFAVLGRSLPIGEPASPDAR